MTGYAESESWAGRRARSLIAMRVFSPPEKVRTRRSAIFFTAGSVVRHRCQFKRGKTGGPLNASEWRCIEERRWRRGGAVETLTDIGDLVAKERTIRGT